MSKQNHSDHFGLTPKKSQKNCINLIDMMATGLLKNKEESV